MQKPLAIQKYLWGTDWPTRQGVEARVRDKKDASEVLERGKNIITAGSADIATLFKYFFKVLERKTIIFSLKDT